MKNLCILFLLLISACGNFANAKSLLHYRHTAKKNAQANCPILNDSQIVINPSACNTADGSITGIKGTGTGNLSYTWTSRDGTVVGNNADLLNVPADTYILKFHDDSKCTAVTKNYVIGQRVNITYDDSNVKIKASDCSAYNGAITNISIKGAVKIEWYDSNNTLVGSAADLTGVTSGFYKLMATGTTGCTATYSYQVPSSVSIPPITRMDTLLGTCNSAAGIITLTLDVKPTDPVYNFAVIDDQGAVVSTGELLYSPNNPSKIGIRADVPNSKYTLQLTDNNNCRIVVGEYSLPAAMFTLETKNLILLNDACGRHTGAIEGLKVTGGTGPEHYYGNPPTQNWTWTDSAGTVLGHIPDLSFLGKGTYTITIKDIGGCMLSRQFAISDSTAQALPPKIDGVTLCLPGVVTLSVINPDTKLKYRLYDSAQMPITENYLGMFQQHVTQTTKFSVTTVDNLCESDPTPLTVTVVAPGVIIPNTFTPNNDGINDIWDIPHIADFPGAEVFIYTRDGALIYHSVNYSKPFNGEFNGKQLPTGVYYYTIDLKSPKCIGKISGSLTLIR